MLWMCVDNKKANQMNCGRPQAKSKIKKHLEMFLKVNEKRILFGFKYFWEKMN